MNKLLLFPLTVMLFATIFTFGYSAIAAVGGLDQDLSDQSVIIDESGTWKNATVEIPGAESQQFDIWGSGGVMVIIIAAIAVALVGGINVVGTGLSDQAQSVLFDSVFWLGLYGVLSVSCYAMISSSQIFVVAWILLTLMYGVGFMMDAGGASDA